MIMKEYNPQILFHENAKELYYYYHHLLSGTVIKH